MVKRLTEEECDRLEAARVERDPSYRPACPGIRTQQAIKERDTREHQFNGNSNTSSEPINKESTQVERFMHQLQIAMIQSAAATTAAIFEQVISISPSTVAKRIDDLKKGIPISFASHAVDIPADLPVSLSNNTTTSRAHSVALDPKKAYTSASFKNIASGAFATGGPSLAKVPQIEINVPQVSTLPGGVQSVFGNHTDDIMPMTSHSPVTTPHIKGIFKKVAKPVKAPEPVLQLMPGIGPGIDLRSGRPDAPNLDHFRLEA